MQQQLELALAAYTNACLLNPALLASWQAQWQILQAMSKNGMPADSNRDAEAALTRQIQQAKTLVTPPNLVVAEWAAFNRQLQHVKAQLQRLKSLPKTLLAVTDLLAQGRLRRAEALCRKFLKANPTHTEAMRLLAEIAMQFGELEDAEYLLESAVEFDPGNWQLKVDFLGALRRRQKHADALAVARQLHEQQPDNPRWQSLYAIELLQVGEYDSALALFDQVLACLPGDPATLTSRGHALKTCGRQAEAVDSYRAAIASSPLHGDAWHSLANLKTWQFNQADIGQMLALEQRRDLSPASRVQLAFALGKALEDEGDYARSFEFYERGNSLKRQQSHYDAERMAAELQSQQRYFTLERLARREASGVADPDPIFILGLPRAGSTLLEQILSSHSQVDGTLELPNILALAQKLKRQGSWAQAAGHSNSDQAHAESSNEVQPAWARGRPGSVDSAMPGARVVGKAYPELLDDMSHAELRLLGQQYLDETRIHRRGAPFFIDKMPNNFRHIGFIKLILPRAKIIDARREPLACCFSGFKQLFAEGQEFTYSLEDLGSYYRGYVQLMDHWHSVLPGEVLTVQHEAVVADLEGQVRRLLDFCGLDFEESCLHYFETERAIRTPSSEQVRQPIFADSLEQWRHYEPWLDPLKKALGGLGR